MKIFNDDPSQYFSVSHYPLWRENRIKKIMQIFGSDYFKGKTVLEVACGHGHIGKHFREQWGAQVTFAEAREEHLTYIAQNNPGADVFQLNQEYDWKVARQFYTWNNGNKFDAIIHFGVLYHLVNWRHDLRCAMEHSDLVILETEVADSDSPNFERRHLDYASADHAYNELKIATRPSAAYIEAEILRNGGQFKRYDDADLNSGPHVYDWAVTGSSEKIEESKYSVSTDAGRRRFWVVRGGQRSRFNSQVSDRT